MTEKQRTFAFIGGTGDLGSGLAWRVARAGYPVVIGSRSADKAVQAAADLARRGNLNISGMSNSDAAEAADIVFMTVPFASHQTTLDGIRAEVQGKIFVDTTVPLMPPKVMRVQLPPEGCVARRSQNFLGDGVRVVSAFQNVAAAHLQSEEAHLADCDVLVTGNDADARELVVQLAGEIGFKAWHAGVIDNSAIAEALTSALIFMNKRYGIAGAGIRITGTPTVK
ncbi:MAG: NADPH-dependent F420 reductase [Azonexus sp.]|jgi:NADPH-dependent F420 reductase|nr:NADPH-dependent F420 reductase [Azonexus sp.]